MFGSHLSIAGSMTNALHEAQRLGLETVQVFTKNQQQWKAKPLDPAMVRDWRTELARLGWLDRTVSHASYLINLASCDDELLAKSVDLMTDEIERCAALSIPLLVHHPGSFVGWTLDQGIDRIASAYRELFRRTRGLPVVSCLEGTAGAGSHIGGRLEHLATLRERILDATSEPSRVGFCLDTCHLHVAGYDMSTRASAARVLEEFDQRCGIAHLRVWHLNDSKGKLASHLDRHEHIGLGHVGGTPPAHAKGKATKAPPRFRAARLADSGFATIVQHPAFAHVPKILETPKEDPQQLASTPLSRRLDAINLRRLRDLLPDVGAQPAPAHPRPGAVNSARPSTE